MIPKCSALYKQGSFISRFQALMSVKPDDAQCQICLCWRFNHFESRPGLLREIEMEFGDDVVGEEDRKQEAKMQF